MTKIYITMQYAEQNHSSMDIKYNLNYFTLRRHNVFFLKELSA